LVRVVARRSSTKTAIRYPRLKSGLSVVREILMGDYTGLRFTAPLNPLGRQVADLMTQELVTQSPQWALWEDVRKIVPRLDLTEFLKYSRNHFIPRGGLCYQPQDWVWANTYDRPAGTWSVCCSYKDDKEQSMTKCFIYKILKHLIGGVVRVEVYPPDVPAPQVHILDGTPLGRGLPFGETELSS
jgi:hypothetical protein